MVERTDLIDPNLLTGVSRCTLEEGGWTPARMISVDNYRAILEEEGFNLNSFAKQFLESLGGITAKTESGAPITFDPREAMDAIDAEEDGANIKELVGSSPCPIGYGDGVFVLILEDGRILLLNDQWHCFWILDDVYDGLNHLLNPSVVKVDRQDIPREFVPDCYQ